MTIIMELEAADLPKIADAMAHEVYEPPRVLIDRFPQQYQSWENFLEKFFIFKWIVHLRKWYGAGVNHIDDFDERVDIVFHRLKTALSTNGRCKSTSRPHSGYMNELSLTHLIHSFHGSTD